MSDELIDSYIDREGVKRDTVFMVDSLNSVFDAFKKVESVKLDLKGLSGLSTIAPGMQQASSAAAVLAEATQTVQERIAQLNGHSKEFTAVLLAQIKAQKEAAQATLLEAKADTERAKAKQTAAKAGQDAAKAAAVDKKIAEDLTNDYLQLSKAYNEAALRAKNLALRLGEAHPVTLEAVADAKAMYAVLLRVDQAVGQSQRNVGNYKSAFDGLRVSFSQVSRELPSLTVSAQQFFLAISNNLPMVADEIAKARVEIAALRAAGEPTPSLFSRITSSLLSWQVGLSVGITLLTAFGAKLVSAVAGLFDFSSNAEKAEKFTKSFNEALDKSKASVDAYASSIAFANNLGGLNIKLNLGDNSKAGLTDLREQSIAQQELTRILEQSRTDLNNSLIRAQENRAKGIISDKKYTELEDKANKRREEIDKELNDSKQKQTIIYTNIALQKIKIQKDEADAAKDAADKAKEFADRKRKAEFDILILEQQQIAEANKAILEDDTKTHAERIIALNNYSAAKIKIIDLETEYEKGKSGKLKEELDLLDKQSAANKVRLAKETADSLQKINAEIYKYTEKAAAEEVQVYDKLYKDLTERFKRYLKEKEKLDKESKDREKEEAALQAKFEQELITSSINLTKTLLEAGVERQKNAVQDQINALDTQKAKDIEVANQTITNAQERAAAISVIEARATAQKEALQRKQRDLDVKKAEFEKAAAIANIIQQTAQNLVKAFPNPGLIALASALGAVQLATVIAQPIPRYKTGKNVHDDYEGPAIVGDGGKREAIIREDGSVQITGSTPELTHVGRNDIIIPDANKLLAYQLARSSASITGQPPIFVVDSTAKEIRDMKNAVVGAIKKIPQPQIEVSNVIRRRIRSGDSTNTYLNSNLQG